MADRDIVELRHELHRNPEISNKEYDTSDRITAFMNSLSPDEVISLASTGKAFVFNGREKGDTVMFRAELDALPVIQDSSMPYASLREGVSHACGHDGHMSILAGLAKKISARKPDKGRVVLLFQPAEEVEQGARDVVNDSAFRAIEPDYIFALHNIPGEEKGCVILREGTFAAASRALTVRLHGRTSHAAEPEKGISPAMAISRLISEINLLVSDKTMFSDVAFITIVHINLGEKSAGTSPGYAEIMMTLRSYLNSDMETLTRKTEEIIGLIAEEERLTHDKVYNEVFPAVVNNSECVEIIKEITEELGYTLSLLTEPKRWSEDFSYFTEKYRGAMFGLGAGTNHPDLHTPEYDFPDDLLDYGTSLFYSIYSRLLLKE